MGLLSDDRVHSYINHLKELIELSKEHNIEVYCRFFLDVRDAALKSAFEYKKDIKK